MMERWRDKEPYIKSSTEEFCSRKLFGMTSLPLHLSMIEVVKVVKMQNGGERWTRKR